jgi:hypothetical protein
LQFQNVTVANASTGSVPASANGLLGRREAKESPEMQVDTGKAIVGFIRERLQSDGFVKRKLDILTCPASSDTLGWLGLNKAKRGPDVFELNPVIGVRNQTIERTLADIMGEEFDEIMPPTLAGNIGYLTPGNKYRAFLFARGEPFEPIAEDLVSLVKQVGLPYIQQYSALGPLVQEMLHAQYSISFQLNYRIPIGLFLLGRTAEAAEYLQRKLDMSASATDPAALRYRTFATTLLARSK